MDDQLFGKNVNDTTEEVNEIGDGPNESNSEDIDIDESKDLMTFECDEVPNNDALIADEPSIIQPVGIDEAKKNPEPNPSPAKFEATESNKNAQKVSQCALAVAETSKSLYLVAPVHDAAVSVRPKKRGCIHAKSSENAGKKYRQRSKSPKKFRCKCNDFSSSPLSLASQQPPHALDCMPTVYEQLVEFEHNRYEYPHNTMFRQQPTASSLPHLKNYISQQNVNWHTGCEKDYYFS